ncbi:MAG: DNRLRE domain-containing protein, partial [Bacteroidota bacterium]|nr:DNRLRE domain-containing protein [Bacteroidota bacterium]
VLVNPSPIDSLTLTDADAGYFDLTFAGNSSLDYTDPQSPGLDAAAWSWNGLPDILRGSLSFDLSKLPQHIIIQSAKLNLYSDPTPNNGNLVDANYGSDNSISIQRITSTWSMSSGWFSQPTTSTQDQVIIPHTDQPRLDLIGIDVTPMVTAMYAGSNYGFFFRLVNENENTSRLFCGVRHADASKHPSLKVVFKYN